MSLNGDVQPNPGRKNKYQDINFAICPWNLNSIAAHNYANVFLLKAYISVYKLDIVCISEIRSNHPSNYKRGSVCIYYFIIYKNLLALN